MVSKNFFKCDILGLFPTGMCRRFVALAVVLPLLIAGCNKPQKQVEINSTPPPALDSSTAPATPAPVALVTPRPTLATPAPVALTTPTPNPAIDRNARVMILCYHRFEDRPHDSLAISPAEFRTQMQALKDGGIAVIPMKDFLAWRQGEKNIPPRSCIITIADGYVSGYSVAWPILKQYGYSCTMFIYTNYVNVGGKSITWAQLEEMRDAGVDIESLTVSHHDLRHAPKGQDYNAWLHNELYTSKQILENKLGIKVTGLALPYGTYNDTVRKVATEAGYQALFTLDGRHMGIDAPANNLGCYVIESKRPEIFKSAMDFRLGGDNAAAESIQFAAAPMVTEPINGQHISDSMPTIKANLATMGEVDADSVEMRVSGVGLVPAHYEPKSKVVTYAFTEKLMPKTYTVVLSARVKGRKLETRWNFTVDGG
jgi:peptidoglycan/xylan/chitin deacetylase (PgdA/CDA1 family)